MVLVATPFWSCFCNFGTFGTSTSPGGKKIKMFGILELANIVLSLPSASYFACQSDKCPNVPEELFLATCARY